MKVNFKSGLGAVAYVAMAYSVGVYLGYRVGKSQGRLEVYVKKAMDQLDKDMAEMQEKYPEYFSDEESQ